MQLIVRASGKFLRRRDKWRFEILHRDYAARNNANERKDERVQLALSFLKLATKSDERSDDQPPPFCKISRTLINPSTWSQRPSVSSSPPNIVSG